MTVQAYILIQTEVGKASNVVEEIRAALGFGSIGALSLRHGPVRLA